MVELLVIIGAELILLVSIVAMMVHERRVDVLSHGWLETDYAVSDSSRAERPRRRVERERDKL
jgi:hypothetical protein